jgi:hypothetical protein
MGLRQQPGKEIPAALLVDEIGIPPPKARWRAPAFPGPCDCELHREDRVENVVCNQHSHRVRQGYDSLPE